jgi:parallel beta-helix repeat protein
MNNRRAQGAFEYVLLLAGILLIVVVVITVLRSSIIPAANQTLQGGLQQWQQAVGYCDGQSSMTINGDGESVTVSLCQPVGSEEVVITLSSSEIIFNSSADAAYMHWSTGNTVVLDVLSKTGSRLDVAAPHSFSAKVGGVEIVHSKTIAAAATAIGNCVNISSPGFYVLNQSLGINGATCIQIQSDEVNLSCRGYSLTGNNTSSTYGAYAAGRSNVVVKRCNIRNFAYGIYFLNSNYSEISYNNVSNSTSAEGRGILLNNSFNNAVKGNLVSNATVHGIDLVRSGYNVIYGNTVLNSSVQGILTESNSTYNVISSNFLSGNKYFGIGVWSPHAVVVNNTVLNSTWDGIGVGPDSSSNTVSNNTVSNNGRHGIYLDSQNNNVSGNTVSNNSQHGMFFDSNSFNNTIYGNYACNNNRQAGGYFDFKILTAQLVGSGTNTCGSNMCNQVASSNVCADATAGSRNCTNYC